MSIEKQMEMFEDGGLKDEGGSVDPVSGNDVPVGSTQEEVRDDIPAQLSEGEFVLPADVVRYHGLDKIMRLRDEAKAGLQRMEAMGQMGNSEEAIIPDGVPFDINDLDIDDEPEYNNTMEMQVGGFVQPQGFTGIQSMQPSVFQQYQPQYVPYQPVAPMQAGSQQYVAPSYQPPTQAVVPQMQMQQTPKFQDFIGTPTGGYDELREYRNATTGEVIKIPFVGGQPIYPIPEGFTYQDPEAVTTEQVTTTPTTPQSTTVRDTDRFGDGDGDGTDGPVGPGTPGTAQFGGDLQEDGTVENSTTMDVSYNIPGTVPGIIGGLMSSIGMATQGLPEDATMTVSNPNVPNSVSLAVPAEIANASVIGPDGSVSSANTQEIVDLVAMLNDLGYNTGKNTVGYHTAKGIEASLNEGMLGSETGLGSGPTAGGYGGTGRGRSDVDVHTSATAAGNQPQSQGLPGNADGSIGTGSDVSQAAAEAAMGLEPFGGDGGGGSSGAAGGSSGSGGSSCFAAGTKFIMQDGSLKNIENIKIGDQLKLGGRVYSIIQGDGLIEDWYNYGNTKVTGNHAIYENGEWKRVKDAKNAIPALNKEEILYTLINEKHRMIAEDGVMYTDYDEIDNTGIEEDLLVELNKQDAEATAA